jgi:hypothetical protein
LGADAASRLPDILRRILRRTRLALYGLALVIGAHVLVASAGPDPAALHTGILLLGLALCLGGGVLAFTEIGRDGAVIGIVVTVINLYAGLVALMLTFDIAIIH